MPWKPFACCQAVFGALDLYLRHYGPDQLLEKPSLDHRFTAGVEGVHMGSEMCSSFTWLFSQ